MNYEDLLIQYVRVCYSICMVFIENVITIISGLDLDK